MIRIIDGTLSRLDDYNLTRDEIYCFIELMGEIGIKDIQLSVNVYYTMEGELPEGFHYYLEVDTAAYMKGFYPEKDDKIKLYFTPKQYKNDKEVPSYQVNSLEDNTGYDLPDKSKLMKVTGLDNLILGGCTVGMEVLKKKFCLERLILCPENTYHCATAIASLFLQYKGYAVVSSMMGVGEYAATEQLLLSLHVMDRYMVSRSFRSFLDLRGWMENVLGGTVSPITPVLGRRIFYVESGVHVDGILKKPTNYEPYEPELVGLQREVTLGKHSGRNSIRYKIEELRPGSPALEQIDELLEEVKGLSRITGEAVSEDDFIKMIERYERNEKHS
ncbi:homocitrate synthase/isopropylmalate synthase family protein [Anaerocolumna chitinilytica]|uniref:2-isopropylmalate synthase/homocitrate synthase post-catalytic domain-containing protein n=1 Tax=Anaerocolumna chitinilytica TaxID=1727145 RepID=A0A7I8DGV0_9FIRM|nr:hypothetical protein [Anaerocolumna chitinilytica]BCJ97610.1 hypothetical protein bsdcttw_06510 [Anaerocolumna chitinilytica]